MLVLTVLAALIAAIGLFIEIEKLTIKLPLERGDFAPTFTSIREDLKERLDSYSETTVALP